MACSTRQSRPNVDSRPEVEIPAQGIVDDQIRIVTHNSQPFRPLILAPPERVVR